MHSRFSIACAFGGLMFMAGCTPRSEPIEKGPAPEIVEQAAKDDPAKRDKFEMVEAAEKEGAAWSYRWTTVLPCALVVIFGLIGLVDKLRGGYRQVHLTTAPEQPRKTVHAAPPGAWPRDQMR